MNPDYVQWLRAHVWHKICLAVSVGCTGMMLLMKNENPRLNKLITFL